ncbi:hypothetical protein Tco_0674860 [Tanacetum coccineum]
MVKALVNGDFLTEVFGLAPYMLGLIRVLASDTCGIRSLWDMRAGYFPQKGLTTNENIGLTSIRVESIGLVKDHPKIILKFSFSIPLFNVMKNVHIGMQKFQVSHIRFLGYEIRDDATILPPRKSSWLREHTAKIPCQIICMELAQLQAMICIENLAEKDTTENSDAAREAFLAELALDSKKRIGMSISGQHASSHENASKAQSDAETGVALDQQEDEAGHRKMELEAEKRKLQETLE